MEIINYDSKYDEQIKDLLVELQEYVVSIDKYGYNILTDEYREKYFKETMKEVSEKEGKILLSVEDNKVIGLVIGIINNYEENSYEFKAPKRGRITELIVSKKYRIKGCGKTLVSAIENYLKSIGCKAVLIEVFAYNENAKEFYLKKGYETRIIEVIKEL
jgi:ribosomal protein S18 acetylase RimI-like enzyme